MFAKWRVGVRDLAAGEHVDLPVDRLDRAFGSEITASMSLNVRGTAIAAAAPLGILLLAQFSAIWLDDNRWHLPALNVMKGLLTLTVVLLVASMVLAAIAVWPKRRWKDAQSERLDAVAAGDERREGELLLQMVEVQRAVNERKSRLLRLAIVPLAPAVAFTCFLGGWFAWKAESVDVQRDGSPSAADALEVRVPPRAEQLKLATAYAPRVLLHPSERYGPADPADFVKASRLVWHRRGDVEIVSRGRVDPRSLGRACDAAPGGCYSWANYLAREVTRPFHGRGRSSGLSLRRGFALDPDGPVRFGDGGSTPDVPVFFEFRRSAAGQLLLSYWLFYAFSRPHVVPGSNASDLLLDRYSHEGDWENIEIAFGDDDRTPDKVLFYGHGAPKRLAWTAVCKAGVEDCGSPDPGHPIVYSAIDSHASYPSAGRHKAGELLGRDVFDVADARGARWDAWTAAGGLRFATDQPWYGFGGAWGRAGDIAGVTGPLGPGRYKLSASP